jgi:integrase
LVEPLRSQLAIAGQWHEQYLAAGLGEVYLPYALARKYPNAARQWAWQYVFPASSAAMDPRSGKTRRHHLGESVLQRAVKQAIAAAGIHKHSSCHTLRHTYGALVAMQGVPLQVIAAALGHADTRMTERHYAHLQPDYVAVTIRQNLPSFGLKQDKVVDLRGARPSR